MTGWWREGVDVRTGERGTAIFSLNGLYRYVLHRRWAPGGRTACFIMMNASTADEKTDDMTIRKSIGFSKLHRCNALYAVNLGAYISKDPGRLLKAKDPIGPKNRIFLCGASENSHLVIVAWGALPEGIWHRFRPSVKIVKTMKGLNCLGRTKSGAPHHPSRIAYATKLEPWP